jgi:hypothetical protein
VGLSVPYPQQYALTRALCKFESKALQTGQIAEAQSVHRAGFCERIVTNL